MRGYLCQSVLMFILRAADIDTKTGSEKYNYELFNNTLLLH